MKRSYYLIVTGLLALPSYAAAQDLPRMPPSGYFDEVASNPKGNVESITYGSGYPARVYTPPGYSESQTYASMYLMHGLGGSERSWHDNDLYAHIQLDNLIAEGLVDPFIIVFTKNDLNNWNFEGPLIDELIPYIEENYSVSTDPDHRALGGLSMGGMQTINIGFPNADKFHYLMPSSSAPGIQGESQLFPDGGELARQHLRLIFFTAGTGAGDDFGLQNNNTVKGYCESNGLGDIIEELLVEGAGHDRNVWRPSFWNFAQLAHLAGLTNVGGGNTDMGGNTTMGGNTGMGGSTGTDGNTGMGGNATIGGIPGTDGTPSTDGSAGMGGSGGDSGVTGSASNATVGAGGIGTQGSAATSTGSVTTGATTMTGATSATVGMGGVTTTGGQPATAGISDGGGAETLSEDEGGCACSLPGSNPRTPPLPLFAAAAALVLCRARRNLRSWAGRGHAA